MRMSKVCAHSRAMIPSELDAQKGAAPVFKVVDQPAFFGAGQVQPTDAQRPV